MEKEKIIIENEAAYAVFDIFPVCQGHMLITPQNHIRDYFKASQHEKQELWELVDRCREYIDLRRNYEQSYSKNKFQRIFAAGT